MHLLKVSNLMTFWRAIFYSYTDTFRISGISIDAVTGIVTSYIHNGTDFA